MLMTGNNDSWIDGMNHFSEFTTDNDWSVPATNEVIKLAMRIWHGPLVAHIFALHKKLEMSSCLVILDVPSSFQFLIDVDSCADYLL